MCGRLAELCTVCAKQFRSIRRKSNAPDNLKVRRKNETKRVTPREELAPPRALCCEILEM